MEISILLKKSYSFREIAEALCRSPNTVSYEIKNNSVKGEYDPIKANAKARVRKRASKHQWMKIEKDPKLKKYIKARLKKRWNPDEISGRMRKEKQPFYASKTTIYAWLRSNRGQYWCRYLYSKRYYKKKREENKTDRVMIPERVSIDKRFKGADNRTRFGHWERDAMVSRKSGKGALAVGQERKSRLVAVIKTETMSPKEHVEATSKMTKDKLALSYTYDNGIENKQHKEMSVPSFFCDPYSSWQKGGVEHANKMIRRFFPKGTDFQTVSQEKVDRVVSIINNKPRKILSYCTALEVARAGGVLLRE